MQTISPHAQHDDLTPEDAREYTLSQGWQLLENDLSIFWTVFGIRGKQRICVIAPDRAKAWRKAADEVRLMRVNPPAMN